MRRILIIVGVLIVIVAVVVAVLPLYLERNPPVIAEPKWDSPQTRALAARACFDCHSNETHWGGNSLIFVGDVLEARSHLNFSEWDAKTQARASALAVESASLIQQGKMPGKSYLQDHPEANLSDAEKQQLIDGLTKTLNP